MTTSEICDTRRAPKLAVLQPHPAPRRRPALDAPDGWFALATSDELPRGAVLTRTLAGEEVVLYRTAAGEARVVEAYCPHLGAHLGHCGAVRGEALRCGFHGFCFDGAGACVATDYGARVPPKARLRAWHVRERNGVVLAWRGEGEAPAWEVPALDLDGWSPLRVHRWSLRGHPQETTENSVDVGHFTAVHGYRDVATVRPARVEGPHLTARYAMTRGLGPLARWGLRLRIEFEVHAYGLGYSLVDVHIPSLGLRTRQFVLATPTAPGQIDLRIAVSVPAPWRGVLGRALGAALARVLMVMYRHDVAQDFRIWEHKRYVDRPALADGDGPVGLYRRWARQFYGGEARP